MMAIHWRTEKSRKQLFSVTHQFPETVHSFTYISSYSKRIWGFGLANISNPPNKIFMEIQLFKGVKLELRNRERGCKIKL